MKKNRSKRGKNRRNYAIFLFFLCNSSILMKGDRYLFLTVCRINIPSKLFCLLKISLKKYNNFTGRENMFQSGFLIYFRNFDSDTTNLKIQKNLGNFRSNFFGILFRMLLEPSVSQFSQTFVVSSFQIYILQVIKNLLLSNLTRNDQEYFFLKQILSLCQKKWQNLSIYNWTSKYVEIAFSRMKAEKCQHTF